MIPATAADTIAASTISISKPLLGPAQAPGHGYVRRPGGAVRGQLRGSTGTRPAARGFTAVDGSETPFASVHCVCPVQVQKRFGSRFPAAKLGKSGIWSSRRPSRAALFLKVLRCGGRAQALVLADGGIRQLGLVSAAHEQAPRPVAVLVAIERTPELLTQELYRSGELVVAAHVPHYRLDHVAVHSAPRQVRRDPLAAPAIQQPAVLGEQPRVALVIQQPL